MSLECSGGWILGRRGGGECGRESPLRPPAEKAGALQRVGETAKAPEEKQPGCSRDQESWSVANSRRM